MAAAAASAAVAGYLINEIEQSREAGRRAGQAANAQRKRAAGQRQRAEQRMQTEEARSEAVKKRGMDKRRQLAGRAAAAPKGGTLLSGRSTQGSAGTEVSQTLGDSGKTLLGA